MINDSPRQIELRAQMVAQQLRPRAIIDERVLNTIACLPRHHFIPSPNRDQAYLDQPVPIGFGQTISQPYIVALMTEKLQLKPDHHVLEIGTGCGYQTAVLASLVKTVYTIELIETLARQAQENLVELGLTNVKYHLGNGRDGWPESIQFQRIVSTAASEDIPAKWLEQLAEGGKMVLPQGPTDNQKLILIEKEQGHCRETLLCYCRFVKLI